MEISKFIHANMEPILVEWEAFAATFGAAADKMSSDELRDHAKQILLFVADDIQLIETKEESREKSMGKDDEAVEETASATHGRLRYASGFTLLQLIAEYRALRASVLKLWAEACPAVPEGGAKDITRFNEAIDQSLAVAAVAFSEKVNETRDTFLAILGHDLRSPLAATSMAGIFLSRPGAFDDQVHQIGIRVKRSAATMQGMVNDLLALARTQLGEGIPIERMQCDLLEVCHWAIEDASAAHPHAHFELTATGELLGTYDGARLQQLFGNLANNAAQYGAPGTPVAIRIAGEEERVVFEVQNQGPPIPAQSLPTLFDSLVQLPGYTGTERKSSSLGLGLFIARQIAVAHGGTIKVRSNREEGTVFTVEIPRENAR